MARGTKKQEKLGFEKVVAAPPDDAQARYDSFFRAGWNAAAKAKNPQGADSEAQYKKVQSTYGVDWKDGWNAFVDTRDGAPQSPGAQRAKSLGLGPKLTREGIAADRAAALAAVRREMAVRGRPSPGDGSIGPDAVKVSLPSGGVYRFGWYENPLRAWLGAMGVPSKQIKEVLPPATKDTAKPEMGDILKEQPIWPDEFAVKRATVKGSADLVPVVLGKLAPKGGRVVALQVEVGAQGGRALARSRFDKKLSPWAYTSWTTGAEPVWQWVRGNGPQLLKQPSQVPVVAAAQKMLRGTWEAVIEYAADAGPVPVQVTLRRKISTYATLFIQGPAAGAGWRYGWEEGRGAAKWWVVASWSEEGTAPTMEQAIRKGLEAVLSSVIAPSCTKRDTQNKPK